MTDELKTLSPVEIQEPIGDPEDETTKILKQLEEDEIQIEKVIRNSEQLADIVQEGLMKKFENNIHVNDGRTSGNLLFNDNIPDLLQAQARLLSLSIDGRVKVANIRKTRQAIIKSQGPAESEGFDINDL